MDFYIAERDRETGKFVLRSDGEEPRRMGAKDLAELNYSRAVQFSGQNNVMLLRSVDVEVEVNVTINE